MAELRRLLLKIDGDVSNAVLGLEFINKKLDAQSQKVKKVGEVSKASGEDLVRSFSKWSSAFFRFVGLAEMAGNQIKSAFEGASEGAKIMAAQSFFQNAGRSLEDLRTATSGMISDAELMKKANLADSMGISIDTFKTLAKVAQASALKTGQSFDYMFESIIVGTARSSRLLLDNLGIIVSVKEANENYAKTQLTNQGIQNATNAQIQAFIDTMDDAAKKAAFAEEVQRKSAGTLIEMGSAATQVAGSYSSLSAAVSNLGDTLKIAMADAAQQTVSETDTILRQMERIIKRFGVIQGLLAGAGMMGRNLWSKTFGSTQGMNDMMAQLENNLNAFDRKDQAFLAKNLDAQIKLLKSKLDPGETFKGFMDFFVAVGDVGDKELNKIAAEIIRLNNILRYYEFAKPPAIGGGAKPSKPAGPSGKKAIKDSYEEGVRDLIAQHEIFANQEAKDLLEFEKFLASLEPTLSDLQREAKRLEEAQANAAMSLDQLALDLVQPISDAVGQAVGTIARGGGLFAPLTDMANDLMKDQGGIGGVISTGLTGAGMGAGVAGPLGAAIGAIIPVIVSLIDELAPVASFIASIVEGLRLFVRNGLGEFMRMLEPLGPALSLFLAALGNLLAANLRPLIPILTAVTAAFSFIITSLAGFIGVIAPIAEVIGQVMYAFYTGFASLFSLFFDMGAVLNFVIGAAKDFAKGMTLAIININNWIVKAIRSIGFKGFGKILKYDDFVLATDNNTEAVKDNTKAVKDLAREFRNMPAGYKVNRTIYEASNPMSPMLQISAAELSRLGAANATRWRT